MIVDLVGNHTSDEHPWFRSARLSRSSPYRDFYVWCDDPARERGTPRENWTRDDTAGQYYLHRFAPFQPDLNIANPAVRDKLAKTVGFWLQLGVSGFRMDAVPFLVEDVETSGVETGDGKRWLRALRDYATRRRGEAMLMGEVNVDMRGLESYFGEHGDALHLGLAFLINQRLWLSLARGRAAPPGRRRSCATVTSSRSTSSSPESATRSSPPSRPRSACASTATGSAAAPPRCSAATVLACAWRGR